MEVAVIGGSGFLGTHLVSCLLSRGCKVRVISAGTAKKAQPNKIPDLKFLNISLGNAEQLKDALSGCAAIAYLSGINKERQPGDFRRVHVQFLQAVVSASKELSIKKLVYVSFLRARPDKESMYLQSKWEGEELIRGTDLDYTILKPGICFGTGDQMVTSIIRGLKLTPFVGMFATVGMHEQLMRPVHADDMASIISAALLSNQLSRETYAVTGPEELTLSQAVRRVGGVMKKPVLVAHVPTNLMFGGAWMLEHVMNDPLVTVAQIRMLSDGLSQGTPESLPLPDELAPKTYFTEEQIQVAMNSIG